MRPIKFRAWDKEKKKMLRHAYDYENVNYFIEMFFGGIEIIERPKPDMVDTSGHSGVIAKVKWFYQGNIDDRLILMQFTGLKDKNGKEIYEGDVVNVSMSYKGGTLPHRGEIVYDKDFAGFATRNLSGDTLLHNHCLHTIEVIGNIYENGELSKEKK